VNTSPPGASWHLAETYKGMITLAVEVLKTLALVNGGAAIAVLTYLGNLVARAPKAEAPNMKSTLIWYCSGLGLTVLAFIFAYVSQLCLYNEERKRLAGTQIPERHGWGVALCVILAVASALAFVIGSWSGVQVLGGN
jgi:hypothetical protein